MSDQYPSLAELNEHIARLQAETKALIAQQKHLKQHDKSAAIAEIKAILAKFPGLRLTATELGLASPKRSGKRRKARKVHHDPVKNRTWTEGSRPMPKWVRDAVPGSLVISIVGPDSDELTTDGAAI